MCYFVHIKQQKQYRRSTQVVFRRFRRRKLISYEMSFATHKSIIEENDTVIVYLNAQQNMHAITVTPYMKNKKGELIDNVFQTMFGALKVKGLIGAKYGSKVRPISQIVSYKNQWLLWLWLTFFGEKTRLNCQKAGRMYCSRLQSYGRKHCRIEHKSFIRPTLVWSCFSWKLNRVALSLNLELEADRCRIPFWEP